MRDLIRSITTRDLDKLTKQQTAFDSFRAMVTAKGGFRPTLTHKRLADAYDAYQRSVGDPRRAERRKSAIHQKREDQVKAIARMLSNLRRMKLAESFAEEESLAESKKYPSQKAAYAVTRKHGLSMKQTKELLSYLRSHDGRVIDAAYDADESDSIHSQLIPEKKLRSIMYDVMRLV